jgi:hypothetical protein
VGITTDELPFTPEDHDVRIHRGEHLFFVRGVKRGERFTGGGLSLEPDAGGLLVVLLAVVLAKPLLAAYDRLPWKVGVVRMRRDPTGHPSRIRTVHRERLPDGFALEDRIAELVEDVEAGRFD